MKKTFILSPCETIKPCFGTKDMPKNLVMSIHTILPCKLTIEVEFFDYDIDADQDDDLPF